MGLLGKKIEIGPDTIIQRRNDLLFNEIDGEVVMLSIENGEYYGMDQVGSRIWQLLEFPMNLNQITHILLEEYNTSKHQCSIDSKKFIDKLIDKNLIYITHSA